LHVILYIYIYKSRQEQENFWIKNLKTKSPNGINEKKLYLLLTPIFVATHLNKCKIKNKNKTLLVNVSNSSQKYSWKWHDTHTLSINIPPQCAIYTVSQFSKLYVLIRLEETNKNSSIMKYSLCYQITNFGTDRPWSLLLYIVIYWNKWI
jgi:hypothetical protein